MEKSLQKYLIALIDWVYAKKIRNDIVLTQDYIIDLIRKLNDIIKHQKNMIQCWLILIKFQMNL